MVVIKVGKECGLGNPAWQGYVSGYFESERQAEKYLVERGYEKDSDEVFFKETSDSSTDIAKITRFEKIEVSI